ncbi:MAG: hypothetical protein MRZ79_06960 [Bacteroidia bacterium]|nr:hypothetical protein [Bacteroidia bacterium]
MKPFQLILLLAFLPCSSFAQKFSFELNYVIPFGDNFLSENYIGVAELGVKYRPINIGIAKLGLSMKASGYVSRAQLNNLTGLNTQGYFFQPKIFVELAKVPFTKIHPFAEIGYDYVIFRSTASGTSDPIISTIDGGSIEGGLMYDINGLVFIQLIYDFSRVFNDQIQGSSPYNNNLSRLKAGLGVRI